MSTTSAVHAGLRTLNASKYLTNQNAHGRFPQFTFRDPNGKRLFCFKNSNRLRNSAKCLVVQPHSQTWKIWTTHGPAEAMTRSCVLLSDHRDHLFVPSWFKSKQLPGRFSVIWKRCGRRISSCKSGPSTHRKRARSHSKKEHLFMNMFIFNLFLVILLHPHWSFGPKNSIIQKSRWGPRLSSKWKTPTPALYRPAFAKT